MRHDREQFAGTKQTSMDTLRQIVMAPSHRTEPYLYIGKVAELTGASCKAIRHYESLGLIPAPKRRGKYRIYSEQDVFLIHVLKHVQTVGFQLKELKSLVEAQVQDNRFPLRLANTLFDRKRETIRNEVVALQQQEQHLLALKEEMNRVFSPDNR